MNFRASNYAAEHEALLHGLRIATSLGIQCIDYFGDSTFVINQVTKDFMCNDELMTARCQELQKLDNRFDGLRFQHVLHDNNEATYDGIFRGYCLPGIFVHFLGKPTTQLPTLGPTETADAQVQVMLVNFDWHGPII